MEAKSLKKPSSPLLIPSPSSSGRELGLILGDNVLKLYEELRSPTESLSGGALGPPEWRLYGEETAGAFASQQVSGLQDGES